MTGKIAEFQSDEFLESLIASNSIEESILLGTIETRDAQHLEANVEKDADLKTVEVLAPGNYHHGEHISTICKPWCNNDYGDSGGNCAHYAANSDLWNIKKGAAGITYHCPSQYAINAHQMFEHCRQLSGTWEYKPYAKLSKKGLAFGWNKAGDRVVHVGVYAGWGGNYETEWVYHYGFNARKVLANTARWWASNSTWGYYSFFERK